MLVVDLSTTRDRWTFARFGQACRELGVKPRHVLHVGGHLGQEVKHYRSAGAERITYMEPTPECAAHLRTLGDDVTVIEAAAGAETGRALLSLCGGDGCWNTLRPEIGAGDGVHAALDGIAVDVVPIRDVQADADVLVVDTQGTEVEALRSADIGPTTDVQLIIVETQASGHPEAAHIDDVTAHLAARGWQPVLAWNHERPGRPHHTFADVFYLRRP